MSKNFFNPYQLSNPYKVADKTTTKLAFKGTSNSRRVQTQAYDPAEDQEKPSTNKIQFSLTNYKNYLPSKSSKKSNPTSYLDQKKPQQAPIQTANKETKPTFLLNSKPKYTRDTFKSTLLASKLLTGKNQDYKKHARIKTQAYDESISDKKPNVLSKFNNIESIKQKLPVKQDPQKNYKIQQTVGKGTFGVVYKATSLITSQIVAIKKVLQDKRYKNRELQIMKMLHHPNVLEIRDHYYTKQGNQQYLNVVVDYFEDNLYNFNRSYTRKGGNIPPILIKVFAFQMFKGINYLSAISVAHRDIKPHNILIDPNTNKLVICDFGSAKQLVANQSNLAYICSRCYRAPQLIFGATDYTPQIDMWSIGCVLVQMINGQPPFMGDSQLDQLISIIKIIGTPSKRTILQMNQNYDMSQYKFPIVPPKQWKKILKIKSDPLLIDLVTKVLQYSPFRRLNPFQAMCHPYFDELRDQNKYQQIVSMTRCKDLLQFNKQQLAMNKHLVQKLIPYWMR